MNDQRNNKRGTIIFWVGCIAVALVWLILLPRVAQWPNVRARIERNEAAGINPTAVFYTEHPMNREVYQRVQDRLTGPER